METNEIYTTETTTSGGTEGDFPKAYTRLRTVLDALQINALRYCLDEPSAATRKKRAAEIEAWIMPVIKDIKDRLKLLGGDCGDGYSNCGGVCVPYRCPESSEE